MSDIHDTRRFYVGDRDDLDGLTRSEVEDLTVEYYWQAEEHVEEMLNEVHDTFHIGDMVYEAGDILRKARSGGCIAYLGSDANLQENWSALLARLCSSSRPVTALNELSAAKEA